MLQKRKRFPVAPRATLNAVTGEVADETRAATKAIVTNSLGVTKVPTTQLRPVTPINIVRTGKMETLADFCNTNDIEVVDRLVKNIELLNRQWMGTRSPKECGRPGV